MNTEQALARVQDAMNRGAWSEAEDYCRWVLAILPQQFAATALLGQVLMRAGRVSEAFEAFERAMKIEPGHSQLFTAASILQFRQRFGPPKAPRPPVAGKNRIQMTTLGSNGRFGNQLLQYGFTQLYARERGLAAEFPQWIGRDLFDLDDPVPSGTLPKADEKDSDFFAALNRLDANVLSETDISGYFCGDTSQWGARADAFRALFVPGLKVSLLLDRALQRLRGAGKSLVAIHLRQGDFGYDQFWIAPPSWYLRWLRGLWPSLDNPVLYVATDDRKVLAQFAEFAPWDARALETDIPGADFFLDHFILSNADHLAVSNSTFSFSAAMLNKDAVSFVRPDPDRREMVPFHPWASPVLLRPLVDTGGQFLAELDILQKYFSPADTVLHLGEHCALWTNLARKTVNRLKIHEADSSISLDSWRLELDIPHLRHLVVEDASGLAAILGGATTTLRHARVDTIHFRLTEDGSATQLGRILAQHGYVLFRVGETGEIEPLAWDGTLGPARYIAMQERLVPPAAGAPTGGLDIPALCSRYAVKVRGVVHVGAHEGREIAQYDAMGVERVLFIEANPAVFARLAAAMRGRSDVITVNRAISDRTTRMQLHLASFDQSSSLLPMAQHLDVYPQIVPAGIVEVQATTLDTLMAEIGVGAYNFLNVDVQGAEAMVLRGATETLRHIEAVNIEVNFTELYRKGAQIEEIDDLLLQAGFRRVAMVSLFHPTWGDAFYIRAV